MIGQILSGKAILRSVFYNKNIQLFKEI